MPYWRGILLAAAVALGGWSAAAQNQDLFPPGVLLLSRVQRHVREEIARLPDISCLETLQREHQAAGGKLRPLDTVRIEVLSNGSHELYASPGERRFSEDHPVRFIGSGVIGDGFFGLYLKEVLINGTVSYEYKGEEELAGRRLARYDFRLPLNLSGHRIIMPEGNGIVGMRGSFWADPRTYDVARLEMDAVDFPPALPLTDAVTIIDYAPTTLAEGRTILLPVSGDFRMTKFSGEFDHNHMEFTHCRLFGAQSTISFAAPGAASEEPVRFGTSSNDDTLRPLAPGLEIAVKLTSGISGGQPVGALIEGTVSGNVPAKGPAVIPSGARVRGRIRRLERYSDPIPNYVVGIEFTEIESGGIRYRFFADLVELERVPGVEQTLNRENPVSRVSTSLPQRQAMPQITESQVRGSSETYNLPGLPGVAVFFVRGSKLDLPKGFRTVWKTRSLAP
ncbi:MAG TPA: hypothetical protein VMH28_24365 [Candidatus Acidoferrales bacterium]|nr:hypothetical protein [Candidatus Acidoferrales bacterium]